MPQTAAINPAIEAALNEEIMADPDLARLNLRNAALFVGGPASAAIPPFDTSAGTDRAGCRLRVVNFLTPVAVTEVDLVTSGA